MASGASFDNPQAITWKCLETETAVNLCESLDRKIEEQNGPQHADEDLISLRMVQGVEVIQPRGSRNSTMNVVDLDDKSVVPWLQRPTLDQVSGDKTSLRVLFGDQTMRNDGLRPPKALAETHISKSLLTSSFHLPNVAIRKLGQELVYAVTYPTSPLTSSTLTSHCAIGGACSAAWSHEASDGTNSALIVLRTAPRSAEANRARMVKMLEILKDFGYLPNLIPFILIDSMIDNAAPVLLWHERDSISDQRALLSGLQTMRRFEMFGAATTRLEITYNILKHTGSILEICKRNHSTQLKRQNNVTDMEWDHMQSCHQSLQELITFRQQELENLIAHSQHLKDKSTGLQSTVMGLMSFNQQEASFNDGKVMKEIAEATKKDSTSMKILALMTVIFLPSTSASTIMAIPNMFDFSSDGGDGPLVSSKFWIFIAVAFPLTLVTMILTFCWLRWESKGRPLPSNWLTLRRRQAQNINLPGKVV